MPNLRDDEYALLAKNAYFRPDIATGDVKVPLGAVPVAQSEFQLHDFSATAYDIGGEIVISFRGTDNLVGDALTGYGLALGEVDLAVQARWAIEFYQLVLISNPTAVISFTGHSLGGGLAGFVASLFHKEAVLFDYMPFALGAERVAFLAANADQLDGLGNNVYPTGADWRDLVYGNSPIASPSYLGITASHIDGEILEFIRGSTSGPVSQEIGLDEVVLPGARASCVYVGSYPAALK